MHSKPGDSRYPAHPEKELNWRSAAVHLADRSGACALVDSAFHVALFSVAMERLLGWSRDEIEGRCLVEALVPPDQRELVLSRIHRALAGTLPSFDVHAIAKDGRRLILATETLRIGSGDGTGLLLTVTSSRVLPAGRSARVLDDVAYQVDLVAPSFGVVRSLQLLGSVDDGALAPGERCYSLLHGRDEACPDCPLRQSESVPWPRTLTRRVPGSDEIYEVVSATRESEIANVRVRRISGTVMSAVYEARVKSLADAAQLSDREREVLRYLLLGRALADVALIMDISLRTVKFHQANVLEKLGVDSRSDLIRLIV